MRALSFQLPLRKKFCTGSELTSCTLDFTFLAPLTSEIQCINSFPNLGPEPLLRSPAWRVRNGTICILLYDFWLVISCTRGRTLHRSRDIAFDMYNVAIFGYPTCVQPRTERLPLDDVRKILHDGQWMACVQNSVETLRKKLTGWVGFMNVTDDRRSGS